MKKNVFGIASGLALSAALLMASVGTVQASACKGLEEKACAANDSCSWIKARTNKKGNEVKAHCRAKGGKRPEKEAKDAGKKAKDTVEKKAKG